MELLETVDLMVSNDYRDRFKAEYYQLKIRADKLANTIKNMKQGKLDYKPICNVYTLSRQLEYMENYLSILEERARLEKIDLNIKAELEEAK